MRTTKTLLVLAVGLATLTSCTATQPAPSPSGPSNIDVTVGEHKLPGTLTQPGDPASRKPIAVLLIAGSGPNDRDETIGKAGNKPLRDIAEALAARGITSLRYDKRTYVLKTAASGETIQAEVLDDAHSAVALLSSRDDLKGYTLFALGHSLGGMVLPNVLHDNPQLKGGVIAAGTPRSLWDVIWDQNVAAVEAMSDKTSEQKAALLAPVKAEVARANAADDPTAPPLFGAPASYAVSLNRLRSAEVARTLRVPLLVIQGSDDFQVSATKDFEAWKPVLPQTTTYKLYPGLSHLFMQASGRKDATAYDEPAHVEAQVTTDIADWLFANS